MKTASSANKNGYRLVVPLLLAMLMLGLGGGVWRAASRAAALDLTTCDLTVGPSETYATIQSAIDSAVSGQTICVRGGEYHEAVEIKSSPTHLMLVAAPGEQPIIDGRKRLPGGAVGDRFKALLEIKAAGTTVDGFEIRYSSARGLDVAAGDVTVRNTRVHDNWSTGINVTAGSPPANVLIENNYVYRNMRRSEHAPVVYMGQRSGSGPDGWTFDPDVQWDAPFWSGAALDLPEQWLNGLSMTFNDDGLTDRVYVGSARAGRVGYIGAEFSANGQEFSYSGADILAHDPSENKWSLYFDGEPLGITAQNDEVIDAFQIESTASISEPWECPTCAPMLLSFTQTVNIPITEGILTPTVTPTQIGPSDLVYFRPTAMNATHSIRDGYFILHKRAAELTGLPEGTNIDALDRAADGRLLISLSAGATLTNPDLSTVNVEREDLVAYDEATGYWSLFFEGDQVLFNPFQAEDLTAAWVDDNDHIYISGDPIGGSALTLIAARDSTARGNHVYENFGEGLVIDRGSTGATAEGNVIYDNQHANLYLNSTTNTTVNGNFVYCTDNRTFWRKGSGRFYRPGPGIQLRDETTSENRPVSSGYVIINNIVYGCGTNFGVSTQRPGGGLNDSLVANNTFAHARGDNANGNDNINLNGDASYDGSSFVNNLLLQSAALGQNVRIQGQADFSTFTVAHNLYSSPPASGWFSGELGRVVGDPALVNPQLTDANPLLPTAGSTPEPAGFRLTYDSPAFGAGVTLAEASHDFAGRPRDTIGYPDIGAYELPHQGVLVTNVLTPAGDLQLFDFTLWPGGSFQLSEGVRAFLFRPGVAASLAVETPAGWRQTAASCDKGESLESIPVGDGAWVTCHFAHERTGGITVRQETVPADAAQSFTFTSDFADPFSLAHGQQQVVGDLLAGVYTVAETLPSRWAQQSAECDDGSPPHAIELSTGERVTCTFINVRLGLDLSLIPTPDKVTTPGDNVAFAVRVVNDGHAATQITELTDSVYGDVADAANNALVSTDCRLPVSLAVAEHYECTFSTYVAGAGGTVHPNRLTVTGIGPGDAPIDATAEASVTVDAPPPGQIIVVKQTDPPDTPGSFAFTASYAPDGFSLSHGQRYESGSLPAGAVYSIAETASPGWELISVTCDDGSLPTSIELGAGETVTCTFVNGRTTSGPPATFYVTTTKAGNARGLTYAPGDILRYDNVADAWSIYFDASDVGIVKPLSDFVLLDDGSILMAVNAKVKLPTATGSLFTLGVQDVARFTPTSLGPTTTGSFELYFDGSDVALSTAGEKIDALAWRGDGALLISVTGSATVKNGGATIKAQDEDLLAFQPTGWGADTTGTWSLAFDGSLLTGMAVEDVTSAWYDGSTMTLYVTVMNNFNVKGVAGTNRTVLAVAPGGAVSAYWDAAAAGYPAAVDGLHIQR